MSPSFELALILDITTAVPFPALLISNAALEFLLALFPLTVFAGELPTLISKPVTMIS